MKHTKRISVLLIALITAFSMMCGTAFADDTPTASITINPNNPAGSTVSTSYTYYELMKASIKGDKVVYYLPYSSTTLKNQLAAVTYTREDGTSVTPFSFVASADQSRWNCVISSDVDTDDGELIANAVNTAAIKAAALSSGNFAQSGGSATTGQVDPGYYLVTSTLGTNLVLQTLNNVTIDTKNSYPSNKKTASKTNMEVGDKVTYTIEITIPQEAIVNDTYVVHDTLAPQLAILDASEAIATSSDDYAISAYYGDSTSNTVTLTNETAGEGETFARSFKLTANIIASGKVTLTYKAELLSTAADDTGYVNKVYTHTPAHETVPSKVEVWTFDFDLDKNFQGVTDTDEDAEDYQATFQLRRTANDESTAIEFVEDAANHKYVVADSDDTNTTKTLTVDQKNNINVNGLAAGKYYLVEMSTSDGYNLLAVPIEVTITDTTVTTATPIVPSHTVSYKYGETTGTGTVTVENQSGTVLPSTGGIGTTIFYVVGAILVIGAGVVLITKRRIRKGENKTEL